MAYPRISENSVGGTRGVAALLTQRRISYKFLDLKGIGKMPIHSIVHCIMAGESANTNSLKRLVLYFKFVIVVGKTEASDLYEIFLNLLL